MNQTIRALNRFGIGARIGEAQSLSDPRGWLRGQLSEPSRPLPGGASLEELGEVIRELRAAQRSQDQGQLAAVRRKIRTLETAEFGRMLDQRVTSEAPYVERLVAFWSNHLCVSIASKRQVAVLAGHYENNAIRPYVLGKFSDMVLASAKHPAMLYYLDNFQSIGPASMAGRQTARRGRARGLNENYARELLELHTVGVDGGYEQKDVEALARILTGWTLAGVGPAANEGDALDFAFRGLIHEPGSKTVLGKGYRAGGVREGEAAIRDLCAHPSTATFIAKKLAIHFVADDPPDEAVEKLARVFRDTDGDLQAVAAALIDMDAAWEAGNVKFRTPQDWLVAIFRAVHAREAPEPMAPLLRQLRHTPWAPSAPKGYGDLQREWADPDSLMNRGELARTLAQRMATDGRLDPVRLLDVVDVEDRDPLRAMVADESISRQERMALVVGGPAFQWR